MNDHTPIDGILEKVEQAPSRERDAAAMRTTGLTLDLGADPIGGEDGEQYGR